MSFSYDACRRIPDPLQPYGDIAGLGVIIGFVVSAWLTILVLIAYYVFVFDPRVDPFANTTNRSSSSHILNPLDELVAKYTRYLRVRESFRGSRGEGVFHKCILALADAQLVTGISILLSGYWSLKHGPGLSAYHWKMVISLAWFSSVTHLSTLTFLRNYLSKRPAVRMWRLTLMSSLFILLFVGFIPTGHFEFLGDQIQSAHFIDLGHIKYPQECDDFQQNEAQYYSHPYYYGESARDSTFDVELLRNGTIGPKNCTISGTPVFQLNISTGIIKVNETRYLWLFKDDTYYHYRWYDYVDASRYGEIGVLPESPAVCFFKGGMEILTNAYVSMISSLILLVYGYLIRAVKLFGGPSQFISGYVQSGLDRAYDGLMKKWEQWLNRNRSGMILIIGLTFLPLQASIYCTLRVFLHLYTSMFAEVFSASLAAIWGTLNINILKSLSDSNSLEENDWTFGQVISLALLSSSLLPILELLYKSSFMNVDRRDIATQTSPAICQSLITTNPGMPTSGSETPPPTFSHTHNNSTAHNIELQPLSLACRSSGFDSLSINETRPILPHSGNTFGEYNQLPNAGVHSTGIIAQRIQESATLYSQIWTPSILVIISGPFVVVILQLLPGTKSILARFASSFEDDYLPTNHLVAAAKTVAFLSCFIQQHIYLRLYTNRLSLSKKRRVLTSTLVLGLATVATMLSMTMSSMNSTGIYAMMFVLPGYCILFLVGVSELCWLTKRFNGHRRLQQTRQD